mmetsp:Transcript_29917/g.58700  ORF Transcript_29917/g.58700 Transcript_29917/m.58700 type:complete len:82 (-) Transcript_29917:289-534(-)
MHRWIHVQITGGFGTWVRNGCSFNLDYLSLLLSSLVMDFPQASEESQPHSLLGRESVEIESLQQTEPATTTLNPFRKTFTH